MCSRVFVYVCDIVSIDSFHSFHVRERKRSIFLRVRFIVESNRERRRRRRNSCDKFHLASTSVAETQFCQNNTLSYVSIVICFVSIHVFAAILRVRACFVVISSFIIAFQTILNVPRTTLTEMLRNTLTQTRRGSDEATTATNGEQCVVRGHFEMDTLWIGIDCMREYLRAVASSILIDWLRPNGTSSITFELFYYIFVVVYWYFGNWNFYATETWREPSTKHWQLWLKPCI